MDVIDNERDVDRALQPMAREMTGVLERIPVYIGVPVVRTSGVFSFPDFNVGL